MEILFLMRSRPTIVRTMDIYNPFVAAGMAADTWPGDAGNNFVVLKARTGLVARVCTSV